MGEGGKKLCLFFHTGFPVLLLVTVGAVKILCQSPARFFLVLICPVKGNEEEPSQCKYKQGEGCAEPIGIRPDSEKKDNAGQGEKYGGPYNFLAQRYSLLKVRFYRRKPVHFPLVLLYRFWFQNAMIHFGKFKFEW